MIERIMDAQAWAEMKEREITRRLSQKKVNPDSFEDGRDPDIPTDSSWNDDEQYRRLKQTVEALQKEEKDTSL